jgi:hypothetical protein
MSDYRGTIKHAAHVSCKSQIHTSHDGFGGGNRTGKPRSPHPPRLAVGPSGFPVEMPALAHPCGFPY